MADGPGKAASGATPSFGLAAELRLRHGGHDLAGERRIALLQAVSACGSLAEAARTVGLSYKGAWDAIEQMGNLAGEPLVERVVGGRGGGGARLTPRGEQLVRHYELVAAEHARFVARLDTLAGTLATDRALLGHLAMKTSARNQFAGTVASIREGAVNDEIEIAIAGGHRVVATITRESRESLGLAPGVPAFALVKASSIILMAGGGGGAGARAAGPRLSARNQLAGRVERVTKGAVNSEVVLALPGGGHVAAVVTAGSVATLGLRRGASATALFKSSSVIVGVP